MGWWCDTHEPRVVAYAAGAVMCCSGMTVQCDAVCHGVVDTVGCVAWCGVVRTRCVQDAEMATVGAGQPSSACAFIEVTFVGAEYGATGSNSAPYITGYSLVEGDGYDATWW